MSTKQPSPIETAVDDFLIQAEVTYTATYAGEKKDALGDKGHTMDAWRVSFTLRDSRAAHEKFNYFTGLGHRVDTDMTRMARARLKGCHPNSIAWQTDVTKQMKPVAPSAASVLYCLLSDGEAIDQSFFNWCDSLGYDTDSRKALATYEACCESGLQLRRVFTSEQREQLANMLQDY